MCGIVGYVGGRDATPILMQGLRRLEYRGYDSAGVAVLGPGGAIEIRKREGKLDRLSAALAAEAAPPAGTLGLGHTRWATHGPPTTANAHPHHDEARRVVVVHNGIIENHAALRAELVAGGHTFSSDTDTEVIAHLIEDGYYGAGGVDNDAIAPVAGTAGGVDNDAIAPVAGTAGGAAPPGERSDVAPGATLDHQPADPPDARSARLVSAVQGAVRRLEGAYALAAFVRDAPDTLVAARHFSPLVVGLGDGESFVASDIPALLSETRRVVLLEDGELAVMRPGGVQLLAADGRAIDRAPQAVTWDAAAAEKGGYTHFMRKEIDEQPRAVADTLRGRLAGDSVRLPELDGLDLAGVARVYLVACGSSLFAALVAKAWIERWARLPVEVAIASELRYGDPILGPDTLVVLVSQSGETADTLAALRLARAAGAPALAVTNVVGSSLARGADATLYLQVGPEISVVATKTLTGQLAVLALLALDLGLRREALAPDVAAAVVHDLRRLPDRIRTVLELDAAAAGVARQYADRHSMFFIGRGFGYPIALEGALKLKELSYLHAEGYAAGELKHGPIAMLDPAMPVFAIATASPTYEKVISNIEEVRARSSEVIAIATAGDKRIERLAEHVWFVPAIRDELSPFLTVIPTQLFAYHVAIALGRDVDQPRNLAKSVTVE